RHHLKWPGQITICASNSIAFHKNFFNVNLRCISNSAPPCIAMRLLSEMNSEILRKLAFVFDARAYNPGVKRQDDAALLTLIGRGGPTSGKGRRGGETAAARCRSGRRSLAMQSGDPLRQRVGRQRLC